MMTLNMVGAGALVVVGIIAVALLSSDSLRKLLFGQGGSAPKSTTENAVAAQARNSGRVEDLIRVVTTQHRGLARLVIDLNAKKRDLAEKRGESDRIMARYTQAKNSGADETALQAISDEWLACETEVEGKRQTLVGVQQAAAETESALVQAVTGLKALERSVQNDGTKLELAAALRVSAEVRQQVRDMNSSIGDMAKDRRAIDMELEEARAAVDLSKGSVVEQELEQLRAKGSRAAIEAAIAKRA